MKDDLYLEHSITLTRLEAKHGCSRTIYPKGSACPLTIKLRPGLKDGSVLKITGVPSADDSDEKKALLLTIYIEKKKRSRVLLALILVAVLAVTAVAGATRFVPVVSNVIDETLPSVSSEIPTLTPSPVPSASVPTEAVTETVTEAPSAPEKSSVEFAAETIKYFDQRWYLNNLEDRLLYNICSMYSALSLHEEDCSFEQPMTADELAFLNHVLFLECPELLLDSTRHYTYLIDASGNVVSMIPEYSISADEYFARRDACQNIVNNVAVSLDGLSEYDKELAAYNYICGSCSYAIDTQDAESAYGALVEGTAKCDGLSLAMKWLCEEMGLSCLVADGTSRLDGTGHAWNVIRVDGVYYTLNITDDVSISSFQKGMGAYSYTVFNSDRNMMLSIYELTDIFSSYFTLPATDDPYGSYLARNGCYVSDASGYQDYLYERIRQLLASGGGYLRMQFENASDYEYYQSNIDAIISGYPASYEDAEYQISCYTYGDYRFIGLLFYM